MKSSLEKVEVRTYEHSCRDWFSRCFYIWISKIGLSFKKPQPQPKALPKLTFRDSRTFVEALSVTKHPKKTVYYESIPDDKEWLLREV